MSELLSEFADANKPAERHPKGWEPGYELNGETGTIIIRRDSKEPIKDWGEILLELGLDPDFFTVIEPAHVRAYDAFDGRKYYYRANVKSRADDPNLFDVAHLIADARKRKAPRPRAKVEPATLAILMTDLQAGKGEGGGTEALAQRLLDRLPLVVKEATRYERVAILCLGDLIEHCTGYYPMQSFDVDLDLTQQINFVQDMLYEWVRELSKVSRETIVAAVPGNHGEAMRVNGKSITSFTDNFDLHTVQQVKRVCDENPTAYGNVRWEIATELHHTIDLSGVPVGLAHGHTGRTYNPERVRTWWANHSLSGTSLARAEILITAHYHHLHVDESMGRTWIQAPAMDGGSAWYTAATGKRSPAGMVLLEVGETFGERGWGSLKVL